MARLAVVPELETELDRLYGLPLDEFTSARNELAGRLKKAGQGDAAEAVHALRKPSVALWAVNQLARRNEEGLKALLDAGRALRRAQEQALRGKSSDALRAATAAERTAVRELTTAAEANLLKLREITNSLTPEESARLAEIRKTFRKNQLLRSFSQMNSLSETGGFGETKGESAEVVFTRRFAQGFTVNANFTGLVERAGRAAGHPRAGRPDGQLPRARAETASPATGTPTDGPEEPVTQPAPVERGPTNDDGA